MALAMALVSNETNFIMHVFIGVCYSPSTEQATTSYSFHSMGTVVIRQEQL